MAGILDKKTRFMDTFLTQTGREQLAKGDNEITCINISRQNAGTSYDNTYPVHNFYYGVNDPKDVICEKYKWSKKHNISWDGITNNSKACE